MRASAAACMRASSSSRGAGQRTLARSGEAPRRATSSNSAAARGPAPALPRRAAPRLDAEAALEAGLRHLAEHPAALRRRDRARRRSRGGSSRRRRAPTPRARRAPPACRPPPPPPRRPTGRWAARRRPRPRRRVTASNQGPRGHARREREPEHRLQLLRGDQRAARDPRDGRADERQHEPRLRGGPEQLAQRRAGTRRCAARAGP